MNRRPAVLGLVALSLLGALGTPARATAVVGQPAPAFSAVDTSGRTVSLADYKGKTVVLEWVNPGCPFVQKHYDAGNMQSTQKSAVSQGVVWLAVSTTARDHADYKSPAELAAWMKARKALASATLMDPDGTVGRAYGARTTPHMYIVDARGTLVYAGAIDSKPTANPGDIASATNHVKVALGELQAGKPVGVAQTRPYGCSVKYPSGA